MSSSPFQAPRNLGTFPRVSTPGTFPRAQHLGTFPTIPALGTFPRVQNPGIFQRVQTPGTFPMFPTPGAAAWQLNAVPKALPVNTPVCHGNPPQFSGNHLDVTGIYGWNNATSNMQEMTSGNQGMDFKTMTSGTDLYAFPLQGYVDCLAIQQSQRIPGGSQVAGTAEDLLRQLRHPAKGKPVTTAYFPTQDGRTMSVAPGTYPGNLPVANQMGRPLFLQTTDANPPKGFWVETVGPTSVTRTYYEHCGKPLLLIPTAKIQPGMQQTGTTATSPNIMITASGKSYPLPPCSTTYLSQRGWSKIGQMLRKDVAKLAGHQMKPQQTHLNRAGQQSQVYPPIVRDQVQRQQNPKVEVQQATMGITVEDLEKGARDIQSEADSGLADSSKRTVSDVGSGATDDNQTQTGSSEGLGSSVDQMSTSTEGPLKLCTLCRSNNETPKLYTSHCLTDNKGIVTCPVLRQHVCPHCHASGDYAHTQKYCPNAKHGLPLQYHREGQDGEMRPVRQRENIRLAAGAYKVSTF